jgi:hypothetical protein
MRAYSLFMGKVKAQPAEVEDVVRLNITVSRELNEQFRKAVFDRFGLRKGDIQRAVEEAIKLWIAKGV